VGVGLRFGCPIYQQWVAIREIVRLHGNVATRERGPQWLRQLIGSERTLMIDAVTHVDLENHDVHDSDLACLRSLPDVEFLNLSRTKVGDDGMKHLCGLKCLRLIDLQATQVGDRGIAHLQKLPQLKKINLVYTWASRSGVDAMMRERPNLEVFHGHSFDEFHKLQKASAGSATTRRATEGLKHFGD